MMVQNNSEDPRELTQFPQNKNILCREHAPQQIKAEDLSFSTKLSTYTT